MASASTFCRIRIELWLYPPQYPLDLALIAALKEVTWKLGVVGYFTGGILLGVVALMFMFDEFAEFRRRGR